MTTTEQAYVDSILADLQKTKETLEQAIAMQRDLNYVLNIVLESLPKKQN